MKRYFLFVVVLILNNFFILANDKNFNYNKIQNKEFYGYKNYEFILSDYVKYRFIGISGVIILALGGTQIVSSAICSFAGIMIQFIDAMAKGDIAEYDENGDLIESEPISYERKIQSDSLLWCGLGLLISGVISLVTGIILTVYGFKKDNELNYNIDLGYDLKNENLKVFFLYKI